MIAWPTDIRLRAERRAGQLLLRWRIAANVGPAAVLKNPRTVLGLNSPTSACLKRSPPAGKNSPLSTTTLSRRAPAAAKRRARVRRRFESSANRGLPHRPMFPGSPLRPSSALSIAATDCRRPGARHSKRGGGA
jgi:hypothetical protein